MKDMKSSEKLIGAVLASFGLAFIISGILEAFGAEYSIMFYCIFDISLFLFITLIYKTILFKSLKDFIQSKNLIIKSLLYSLLLILINLALSNFYYFKFGESTLNQNSINETFKGFLIIEVLLVGIIGPIIEEFIFRYEIFNTLKCKLFKHKQYSIIIAAIISSIIFSIFHLIGNIYGFLLYFILGVTFCAIYEKTNNIIVCIIVHIFNNLLSVLF